MPATKLIRAADVSRWSGQITEAQWKSAKENHGIELAIVGAWHGAEANEHCEASLHNAQDAGLQIAAYAVLNGMRGDESIERAKAACGMPWWDLAFAALDVEVRGVTRRIIASAATKVTHGGLRPIIYTGAWFWRGRLGNPDWAAGLPLWDSRYDGKLDLEFPDPYGPWTKIVGKQYEGSNSDLGFNADLSVFDAEWLRG